MVDDIKVGDRVRSLDFEIYDNYYVEGIVRKIGDVIEGCPRYTIEVDKQVANGNELPIEAPWIVTPPVNGTPTLFSLTGSKTTNFVRKILPN